jgi:alanine racemase
MLGIMPRPILAQIDLSALRHNLAVARRHAAGRRVWAVVKANAYGHGIERVLPTLAAADGLALLDLDEAQRARSAGWRKPILLLEGLFQPADLEVVRGLNLTPVVHHAEQIAMLEARPQPIGVYVKLNTGMQRLGFAAGDLNEALSRLAAVPGLRVESLMTHFANGEGGGAEHAADVDEQLRRFEAATVAWKGETCLANSAALLMQPQVRGDSVRPGILLYGGTPATGRAAASFDLKPAMRLQATLIAVQSLAPGDAVGYGSRWVARRATRIGIIACGYADGYPRVAPDGTPVWVDGRIVPIAGRVSMDMITVDLADAPHAGVGSPVQLWGERVPIDTVAERAGTVGYELMCALAPRVPVATIG